MADTRYTNLLNTRQQRPDGQTESTGRKAPVEKISEVKSFGKRSSVIQGVWNIWYLEILLLFLMLVALVATCITTWKYQNKATPKWPHKITVNTLNAVYGVVMKTAIAVVVAAGISQLKWTWYKKSRPLRDIEYWDQASRGPWGSLLLIWRLRGRHVMATLGALILILALALDPLLQLLVYYDNCPISQPGQAATIPTRNVYDEQGPGSLETSLFVPTVLGHAVDAGILGAATTEVSATCQTGNCTFEDPYHTIGFCSQCEDISDLVSIQCTEVNTTINGMQQSCNFTVPGGYNDTAINDHYIDLVSLSVATNAIESGSFIVIANNLTNWNSTFAKPIPCSEEETEHQWTCRGHGAANCSIVPCTQTYQARVSNGQLQETILCSYDEMMLADQDTFSAYSALDVNCLSSATREDLVSKLKYPIENSTNWVGYRGNPNTPQAPASYCYNQASAYGEWTTGPQVLVPPECIYQMEIETTLSPTLEYIASAIQGVVTVNPSSNAITGPTAARSLYNSGNVSFESINASFASMTTAMTVYVRQSTYVLGEGPKSAPNVTIGTAYETETCMHVRWPYIAYPAALVLLSLVFFVGMVLETFSRNELCDWKDSTLALLFHGLVPASDASAEGFEDVGIETNEGMKRVAEKMYAKTTGAARGEESESTSLEMGSVASRRGRRTEG